MPGFSAIIDPTISQNPEAKLTSLGRSRGSEKDAEKAAKEFESVFLAEMLAPVLESSDLPSPFGGGFAEKTYKSLLTREYADVMAKSGGLGIASQVKAELLKAQEQASWNK